MKYILILLLFVSCKEHVCPPPTKMAIYYDTVIKPVIDTLVIMQAYDTLPEPIPDSANWGMILPGSSETRPCELFKDGKRSDTIYRHTIIYIKSK